LACQGQSAAAVVVMPAQEGQAAVRGRRGAGCPLWPAPVAEVDVAEVKLPGMALGLGGWTAARLPARAAGLDVGVRVLAISSMLQRLDEVQRALGRRGSAGGVAAIADGRCRFTGSGRVRSASGHASSALPPSHAMHARRLRIPSEPSSPRAAMIVTASFPSHPDRPARGPSSIWCPLAAIHRSRPGVTLVLSGVRP